MTEFSDFSQILEMTQPSSNGHEVVPDQGATPQVAHIDVDRGVFVTSRGEDIELSGKRISSLMLERLVNEGKPRIPMKEVLILGKHKQMEAAPNDPGYLAMLAEWESNQKIATLIYVFTIGVKGKPDAEFVEEQRAFFPDASDVMMKYLYVCSLVPDEDIDKLTEAIMGQFLPTAKGIEEAGKFTA
ncbi:MAG: hypothetical protein H0X30_01375 [Anaerolineae bacterium]|nr:hypothetical protein [Anaerolineae bacterium]